MTMERRKPTTEAGRGLLIAMDDGTADMESMLLYAILAVEQQAAAAAIRRADALREALGWARDALVGLVESGWSGAASTEASRRIHDIDAALSATEPAEYRDADRPLT